MKNILFFRILGNDLKSLHGENQTLNNLAFTLKHEPDFPDTDKMFLLNRIYDKTKKNNIISLLNKYNVRYIDLPFEEKKFKKIRYNKSIDHHRIKNTNKVQTTLLLKRKLKKFNLYLVNNNGSRNYCIKYGINNNYKWILPFDSNAFFTQEQFSQIYKHINDKNCDVLYFIIPQIRLSDYNLDNNEVFNFNFNEKKIKKREPQIIFNSNCKVWFNEKIPYGLAPKAELLRVLRVQGPWSDWVDNKRIGIPDRNKIDAKTKKISSVFRLSSHNKNNNFKTNYNLRYQGLFGLIDEIRSKMKLKEGFQNKNHNKGNTYLIVIIFFIFLIILLFKYNGK